MSSEDWGDLVIQAEDWAAKQGEMVGWLHAIGSRSAAVKLMIAMAEFTIQWPKPVQDGLTYVFTLAWRTKQRELGHAGGR